MKLSKRISKVKRIFLDTAPVIYFIEGDSRHLAQVDIIFDALENSTMIAVTTPVTLAECLIAPYRIGRPDVAEAFIDLLLNRRGFVFQIIDETIALKAAELRARYNLTLADSFQTAVAMVTECDAFITNDAALKRVNELNVIVLDEFEPT